MLSKDLWEGRRIQRSSQCMSSTGTGAEVEWMFVKGEVVKCSVRDFPFLKVKGPWVRTLLPVVTVTVCEPKGIFGMRQ